MLRKLPVFLIVACLALFIAPSAFAQSEELKEMKKDIGLLKEGQKAIQKDLSEIKALLQQRPQAPAAAPFKETVISVENDPFMGDKSAMLAVMEFSDYQ
jgi:septal ring factor EnvC (AmiA/AmiB activator)